MLKLKLQMNNIIDELKALIRTNGTDYLPFKNEDQRKLRYVTKKVNAVIMHTETDDVTQTINLAMARLGSKEVGKKKGKRGEKKES